MRDHVLMLALSINMFTRAFHWWSISCDSSVQCVPGGRPTIDLHNFRKWVSKRSSCRLYIVRCPPAKHATDDTTDTKYRNRFVMETFLSCNIHRFIWKIFDACWRWYCKSTSCNFDPYDVNMIPNHFSPPSRGKTLRFTPAVVAMVWGGGAAFVMTIVFSGFRSKPTRSNCLTNASKRLPASTRDCAKIRMSSGWTWNWKFWLPLQAWNWKFWSPQIRINGLAAFYQRPTRAIDNRIRTIVYKMHLGAFQANRWIVCDKNVSIALRLKFFDAMVTSVVCFAAGHRKVYVGWATKTKCTLPKIATAHGWNTAGCQLEWTLAWSFAWVAHPHRTTTGM